MQSPVEVVPGFAASASRAKRFVDSGRIPRTDPARQACAEALDYEGFAWAPRPGFHHSGCSEVDEATGLSWYAQKPTAPREHGEVAPTEQATVGHEARSSTVYRPTREHENVSTCDKAGSSATDR